MTKISRWTSVLLALSLPLLMTPRSDAARHATTPRKAKPPAAHAAPKPPPKPATAPRPAIRPELGPRLIAAVKALDRKGVAALLADGAPPDVRDADDWTPLMTLLNNESSLVDEEEGHAHDVRYAIAAELLRYGAGVNAANKHGWSALAYAAHTGLYAIAILLLQHGAAIDQRDNEGRTPLMTASLWRNNDIVELLLKHCADPNAHDSKGRGSRFYATYHGEHDGPAREQTSTVTVQMLMMYGAK
jgi:ankyrin repeat protein